MLERRLVGRVEELGLVDRLLSEGYPGRPAAIALEGEAGIGKTRLLAEFASRADARGALVLSGSASELERDLPFSVFVDALDEYLRGLEASALANLNEEVRAGLAQVFPSLSQLAIPGELALPHERYRTHRAVRLLLEDLAETRPLMLVLDDLHWADSASIEVLAALLRRPPAAVLIAVAYRTNRLPDRLLTAIQQASRAEVLSCIELDGLTQDEARLLLGDTVHLADATLIYEESGGNPFYLEQLARSLQRAGETTVDPESSLASGGVPSAVAASLREELALLSECTRSLLEGAAVAGDPFEPELAAAAASISEVQAMDALDELLRLDLVRITEAPRRFRFRHPLVRRAAYEATPGAWRLGAHERCAEALSARGSGAMARAHHVERSAREGDVAAVALLREAGEAAVRVAPASAARWFEGALRLLPQTAPMPERVDLLLARAKALTAAGHFTEAHGVLVDALAIVPDDSPAMRARLTRACAGVEGLLGNYEQARQRLASAIEHLAVAATPDGVALLIELAMNSFWRARYEAMHESAEQAVRAARLLGEAPLTAAGLAVLALADSMMGAAERAEHEVSEAAELVESLSDDDLAGHLDAATWLAGAELYLDRYVEADTHASRALALGRATGQGELFMVLVQILGRVWFVRGKLAEASVLLDEGIEAARLLHNTQALVWNLFNRSVVALAMGDLDTALASAHESVDLSHTLDQGFHSAWASVRLAGVLLETGHPQEAVELLIGGAGGEDMVLIPGSWRAYCLGMLTRGRLALDRQAEAVRTAASAKAWASAVQLPLAVAWADRAAAAVDLAAGNAADAAKQALDSAAVADKMGAPIEAAISRTLAGRALAQAGDRELAVAELQRAAEELSACGALRYRDHADQQLRKLGHYTRRRSNHEVIRGSGVESLSERELQVARLVVERKTNREIAAELFLSQKTVEAHLSHIFNKVGVASRVELARLVERADPKPGALRR